VKCAEDGVFVVVGYQRDDHGRIADLKVAAEGADGSRFCRLRWSRVAGVDRSLAKEPLDALQHRDPRR
jgi:hypothetical protein